MGLGRLPNGSKTAAGPPPGGQDPVSLIEAQRRRYLALAERDELHNQRIRGTLISREAVEHEWFKLARQVRDALENVPARLAGIVSAEKNQDKNFAHIQREIRQALESLELPPHGGPP